MRFWDINLLLCSSRYVNTHTHVDRAALVNSGAVVDHDSMFCAGAHLRLGSVVKANCTIELEKKVEAGEVIFSTRRKIEGVDSRALEDALYAFGFGPQCSYVKPFGEGHINLYYAVYMRMEDGKRSHYTYCRESISMCSMTPGGAGESSVGCKILRDDIRMGRNPVPDGFWHASDNWEIRISRRHIRSTTWFVPRYCQFSIFRLVQCPEQFYQSA